MKDTGSVLTIQEIAHTFFVKKNKLILYSISICIDITLWRTVADDMLKCEKKLKNGVYWNWLVAKDSWKEVIVQIPIC